jgi:transmembrane sensor
MDSNHVYEDASLLRKVLIDEATDEEKRQAEELLTQHPELKERYDELKRKDELENSFNRYHRYSSSHAYHLFLEKVKPQKGKLRHLYSIWYSAAAIVILLLGFAWWYHASNVTPIVKHELAILNPGEKIGELVLPNGNHVSVKNTNISMVYSGVKVIYRQGLLSYTPVQVNLNDTSKKTRTFSAINKFVIPRGGENTILLSDGTKVHLNAASELDFPTEFSGSQRYVSLRGEAYFDVAKDAEHPFIVHTQYGNIRVLGTAFNIKVYTEDRVCYVTLVRGKVRFTASNNESKELSPGQQLVLSDGRMYKRNVNVDDYVSWVNGVYNFKEESLNNIMSNFEKWYNIDVVYKDQSVRNLSYTGTVRRYDTMNSFLDVFQLTGDIKYCVEGRTVYLYKRE